MSSWMVERAHIDAMVTAMVAYELILPAQADATGKELWQECLESQKANYPHHPEEHAELQIEVDSYSFEPIPGTIDPTVIERACACYEYQSCEHGGWDSSRACAWTEGLRAVALSKMEHFNLRYGPMDPKPQIDDHAYLWGINTRDVFEAAAAYRRKLRQSQPVNA